MRFVAYGDRKQTARALKPIYTAIDENTALASLDELRADHGKRDPD